MALRGIRSETQLAAARVEGRRWAVAMRDAEWERFGTAICAAARLRLTAVMEHFCDHGERDLPRGAFRWLTASGRPRGAAREGAFEARGTVLRGHATDRVFFVTEIAVDPTVPAPPGRRRRRLEDGGERQLALALLTAKEEGDG
ncbi:hypothetical protein [Sphingomonas sp. BK580]|uniref:hypothetical protein n=1 Tax=Sphingomonas sp. BK580 TaxID=2586972 RepID=UPI0016122BC0|nr:hypothetical protein [Sphingomonas sp. BK580]MBB3693539.1 hypothetical protein [Sphingomonas sp. BK580]